MNTRFFFILMLGIVGFMLFLEWQREYVAPPPPEGDAIEDPADPSAETRAPTAADLPELPTLQEAPAGEPATPAPSEIRASRRIEVITDVLVVDIDANGGTLVDLRLKDYPVEVDRPDEPFVLLVEDLPDLFVAQAGLLADGLPAPNHTSRWEFERDHYELAEGSDRLEVPLTWRDESGLEVVATWIFHRGDYVIDLEFDVRNRTGTDWRGARYIQLQRTEPDFSDAGPAFTNPERFSYSGAAWFSPSDGMRKLSFSDIRSRNHSDTFEDGWMAFIQHYFLAAWIPPEQQVHRYATRYVSDDRLPRFVVSATSPQVTVADQTSHSFTARLYAGPKLQNRLNEVADGLVLTVDYRWFRVLSQPLFWVLDKIHSVINHWGWSIVVLTLLIKLVFYKLTEAQFRSMGKLRKLQPRIQQLKERYGDDRQKFGQAMMDIYKKEKVNPLGGCLPILVQIPIFISLYWVLLESVELRQTSFLWVPDLSRPDPYFILPVLNGIFMIVTQRLMPTAGMDPMQRKLMMWLPVVFAFLFALFPAGLVLYWATNAGVSLAQQWYILKRLEREG
ncbi:MAG: membrane protein insertase YidC [Wenzhouxiangella sp.]|nr:MAG: membrane protein insertase YidC [Wenzhouxiangella sp.]